MLCTVRVSAERYSMWVGKFAEWCLQDSGRVGTTVWIQNDVRVSVSRCVYFCGLVCFFELVCLFLWAGMFVSVSWYACFCELVGLFWWVMLKGWHAAWHGWAPAGGGRRRHLRVQCQVGRSGGRGHTWAWGACPAPSSAAGGQPSTGTRSPAGCAGKSGREHITKTNNKNQ